MPISLAALPDGVRRFVLQDLPPEPWRNGGGLTRQVAAGRFERAQDGAPDAWDWRISVADITADGLFSVFPGIDRTAALLAGESLNLLADAGALHFAQPGAVQAFAGETVLTAQLPGGPARLLNVMTRRGQASAQLCSHDGDAALALKPGDCCALLVVRGAFTVRLRGASALGAVVLLQAGEGLLVQDHAASLSLAANNPDSCLLQAHIQRCAGAETQKHS